MSVLIAGGGVSAGRDIFRCASSGRRAAADIHDLRPEHAVAVGCRVARAALSTGGYSLFYRNASGRLAVVKDFPDESNCKALGSLFNPGAACPGRVCCSFENVGVAEPAVHPCAARLLIPDAAHRRREIVGQKWPPIDYFDVAYIGPRQRGLISGRLCAWPLRWRPRSPA
jgi:hypothetical protein